MSINKKEAEKILKAMGIEFKDDKVAIKHVKMAVKILKDSLPRRLKNYKVREEDVINGKLRDYSLWEIEGNFDCSGLGLTSLEGAPKEVGGTFWCYDNRLTSLNGAPYKVGDFDCGYNKLTSLEGAPKEVGGDFACVHNKLTSLKGAPKEVGGNFWCHSNELTSLNGAPHKVGGDFDCANNPRLKSLEGAPKEVGGDFSCEDTRIKEADVLEVVNVKGKIHTGRDGWERLDY